MRKKQKLFITVLIAIVFVAFIPHAYATAGGFHGGGGGHTTTYNGGGNTITRDYDDSYTSNYNSYGNNSYRSYNSYGHIGYYVSSPFDIIFFILLIGGFLWKFKKPRLRTSNYVHGKDIGNTGLEKEIEQTFISIQEAWDRQDLQSVRNLYTDELYYKHQKVIDDLLAKGLINHTNDVIVDGFSNYKRKSDETFQVDISFVAIDYSVNKDTKQIVQGNNMYRQDFKQRWTFIDDGRKLKADKVKELKV
ncbi:TIM44-like domain-containing protein [Lactococcus lactis]|uniref:TIM44-like domain-containing protein n=1 Tax=Lactococcus lactis TaxID=1358 RepID=UPI0028BEC006|nr:TIM44-like domain-containing protein [Lactococcus lactis]WNN68551.1 TIM44-like domain-containing protein [Lactococcus lactis]WPK08713.1 TIM44-like domain-containing protein [Lactococcus lactis]